MRVVGAYAGTIDWPRVALPLRAWPHVLWPLLPPVVAVWATIEVAGRWTLAGQILAVVLFGTGPEFFPVSVIRLWRWRRLGLRMDDTGITIGGTATTGRESKIPGMRFHVPWDAVYKVEIVTDRRALRTMFRTAWKTQGAWRKGITPARPPYFASSHMPVLTFRVDLRRVELPDLPEGVEAGHVWAVPIRDIEAVRSALDAHCVRTTTPSAISVSQQQRPVMPTEPGHLSPVGDATMEGFCTLGLSEPLPTSFAELEAEVVLHHRWEPFLFDLYGRETGASILDHAPL